MQKTQEMRVQSLGQEDPLEKEMATHSSILALEIPWTGEPGRGLQSIGSQRIGLSTQHTYSPALVGRFFTTEPPGKSQTKRLP